MPRPTVVTNGVWRARVARFFAGSPWDTDQMRRKNQKIWMAEQERVADTIRTLGLNPKRACTVQRGNLPLDITRLDRSPVRPWTNQDVFTDWFAYVRQEYLRTQGTNPSSLAPITRFIPLTPADYRETKIVMRRPGSNLRSFPPLLQADQDPFDTIEKTRKRQATEYAAALLERLAIGAAPTANRLKRDRFIAEALIVLRFEGSFPNRDNDRSAWSEFSREFRRWNRGLVP